MADVAQLGIAVDSSQVKSATAALGQFSTASKTAASASDRLTTATGQLGTTTRTIESMAKRAGVSFDEMRARVQAASDAHGKLNTASLTAVKGMQTLSAQTKKVANDNQALGQQTDRTSSSLEKFAVRFSRGLIAGVAIQTVRQLTQYIVQLNAAIAQTADTAQRVGVGGQQFQGLQTTASYKGVSNSDFNSAMLGFNQQVDLAKHGLGDLQALLSLNGKTVKDTASTFGIVADLVKNAGTEAQKFSILQAAGLPATREFAKLMEQGGASISKQADAAAKLTQQQLDEAKRVDDAWNKGWTDFENWGKRAVVNVLGAMGRMSTEIVQGLTGLSDESLFRRRGTDALKAGQGTALGSGSDINSFYNGNLGFGTIKTPNNPTNDLATQRQQNALAQQRLGLLSPLATVEDQVRAKQLEINAAALNNVHISQQQAQSLLEVTRAQAEMSRVQQQAQIGVFDLANAQKAANDNLKALVDQHLLDPNNPAQWAAATTAAAKSTEQLAQQAKVAGAPLEQLQRLANTAGDLRGQLDTTAVTSLNGINSELVDMASGAETAGSAFGNMGKTIERAVIGMITQMTIIKPLATSLQSVLGGFTGGSGISIPGFNPIAGVTGHATGGPIRGPGTGTSDSILARVSNGEFVVNAAATARNLSLLHAINDNVQAPKRASFAGGGLVAGQSLGAPIVNLSIVGAPSQPTVTQKPSGTGGIDIQVAFANAVTGVMQDDAAKNGPISKAFAARAAGFKGA